VVSFLRLSHQNPVHVSLFPTCAISAAHLIRLGFITCKTLDEEH
jgi:hypothetical protein